VVVVVLLGGAGLRSGGAAEGASAAPVVAGERAPDAAAKSPTFSCQFKDARLEDVLHGLALACEVSILTGDLRTQPFVNVFLQDVTLEQALTALLHGTGLTYVQDTPTLYRIIPAPQPADRPFLLQYEDGKITLAGQKIDLLQLLAEIGKVTGTNIVAARDVKGEITVTLSGLTLEETLAAICLQGGYAVERKEPELYYITVPADPVQPPFTLRFEGERLSVEAEDVDLLSLLAEISRRTNINLIPARGIGGKVTVAFADLEFEEGLQALCLQCGYYLHKKENFYLISPKEPEPEPPPPPSSKEPEPEPSFLEVTAEGERLNIKARRADLVAVLAEVAEKAQVNIVPVFGTKAPITLSLSQVSVEEALTALTAFSGHHWQKQGDRLYVVSQEARAAGPEVKVAEDGTISLNARNADVQEVIAAIADQAGVNTALSSSVQGQVSLSFTNLPVEKALATIASVADLHLEQDDDVFRFSQAEPRVARGSGYFELTVSSPDGEKIGEHKGRTTRPTGTRPPGPAAPASRSPAAPRPATPTERQTEPEAPAAPTLTRPGATATGEPETDEAPAEPAEGPPSLEVPSEEGSEEGPPGPLWNRPRARARQRETDPQSYRVASAIPVARTINPKIENRKSKIENPSPHPAATERASLVEPWIAPDAANFPSPISHLPSPSVAEPLITLDATAANLGEVLEEIARQSETEIVIYGGVQELATAQIRDAPLSTALRLLLLGTNYGLKQDEEGRYLIGNTTLLEHGGNPAMKALAVTEVIPLQHAQAEELVKTLSSLVPEAQYKVNKNLNILSLTGDPELLARARQEIQLLDRPTPRVKISVRVLEISGSDSTTLGFSSLLEGKYLEADFPAGEFEIRSAGNLGEGIDLVVQALVEKGHARVLAHPTVVTLSGHEADIDIGQTQYFKTLGFPTLGGGAQGGNLAFEQLQPIQAGVRLTLTPTVTGAGDILLEVEPSVSSLSGVTAEGLPEISERKAKSSLRVRPGETILIGGLKQREKTERVKRVPILSDIPVLGELFKWRSESHRETELVITMVCELLDEGGAEPGEWPRELAAWTGTSE